MKIPHIRRFLGIALAALAAAVAVAACGSSAGGNANQLLRQTFSGAHPVNSGNLSFSIRIQPSGSSTISGPVTISFGGPFQSLGKGKLPASDFNISLSADGRTGSLGILSTGTSGYVSLQGTSYKLPPTTFQQLESSFASLSASPGSGSSGGTLSKLGINPLQWLKNASVVGHENVAGTDTTHIHAGVNVPALLRDLSTFLGKASSASGGKLPTSISPATQSRIAQEVRKPSFDVWTGSSDKTVRRMLIKLTLPVTGQISTLLGGLSSAAIAVTMQYADLNKPQTISAPTKVAPYSQFQAKLAAFLQELSALSGGATGSTGSSGSSGSGSSGSAGSTGSGSSGSSGPSSGASAYSRCIQQSGGDVTKMQRCAPLLGR